MIVKEKYFDINGLNYIIRSAILEDAKSLSTLRVKIDSETENLDREIGENFISEEDFKEIIENSNKDPKSLFLVSTIDKRIIGFSRCVPNQLKRFSHKAEFGICILKDYWGFKIGKNILIETIKWAENSQIKKITLSVLETNTSAINLYEKFGFEIEGILKKDRKLSNGMYYSTIIMSKFIDK